MALSRIGHQAQQFVATLPRITLQDLPKDSRQCPICLDDYDQASADQVAEEPVKLPCSHMVGSRCLEIWLNEPNEANKATCPHCRYELFQESTSPEIDRSSTHSEQSIPSAFDYGESDGFDQDFVDRRVANLIEIAAPSSFSARDI